MGIVVAFKLNTYGNYKYSTINTQAMPCHCVWVFKHYSSGLWDLPTLYKQLSIGVTKPGGSLNTLAVSCNRQHFYFHAACYADHRNHTFTFNPLDTVGICLN